MSHSDSHSDRLSAGAFLRGISHAPPPPHSIKPIRDTLRITPSHLTSITKKKIRSYSLFDIFSLLLCITSPVSSFQFGLQVPFGLQSHRSQEVLLSSLHIANLDSILHFHSSYILTITHWHIFNLAFGIQSTIAFEQAPKMYISGLDCPPLFIWSRRALSSLSNIKYFTIHPTYLRIVAKLVTSH